MKPWGGSLKRKLAATGWRASPDPAWYCLDGGNDRVEAGAGDDFLYSGAAFNNADSDHGGEGNDLIRGNGGKDSVQGGLGADELWGGEGADRFVYTGTAESPTQAAGTDWIKDFEVGVDKIHLRPIDANGNAADGLTAFSFIGGSAFSGKAGELRVISNGSASFVQADINGDGNADFAIQVTTTSVYPLGRNDFEI